MRAAVFAIEIPAGATVGATYSVTTDDVAALDFSPQGLRFDWNGRSGGSDAAGLASHRAGVGFWAPNGQVSFTTGSANAVATSQASCRHHSSAAVALVNGAGADRGTATASVAWDGTTATVTLTVATAFAEALTVQGFAVGGLSIGCQVMNFAWNNATTSYTFSGLAATPDALDLVTGVNAVQGSTTFDDSQLGIGFAARNGGSTEQAVVLGVADDGKTGGVTRRWASDAHCVAWEAALVGGPIRAAASVAWTADGFTLSADTPPAARVIGLAYLGCDARVLSAQTLTNTTESIPLDAGWQPAGGHVVSDGGAWQTSGEDMAFHEVLSVGVFDGGLTQAALGVMDTLGANPTAVGTAYRDSDVYVRLVTTTAAVGATMAVTGVDASGLTLQMTAADDAAHDFAVRVLGPSDLGTASVAILSPLEEVVTIDGSPQINVLFSATDAEGNDVTADAEVRSSDITDGTQGLLGGGSPCVIDLAQMADGARTISVTIPGASDSFLLTVGPAAGGTTIQPLEADVPPLVRDYGAATTLPVPLRDADGNPITANLLAPGDVRISLDGGASTVTAGDAGAAGWSVVAGRVFLPLSAAEVAARDVYGIIRDQDDPPAFLPTYFQVETQNHPSARYPHGAAGAATCSGGAATTDPTATFTAVVGAIREGYVAVGSSGAVGVVAAYDAGTGVVTWESELLNGALAAGEAVVFWTGSLPVRTGYQATASSLGTQAKTDVATGVLDLAAAVDGLTPRQVLGVMLAVLRGKVSGMDTNTPVFRDAQDTLDRITAVTDASGNRTSITVDLTGL